MARCTCATRKARAMKITNPQGETWVDTTPMCANCVRQLESLGYKVEEVR